MSGFIFVHPFFCQKNPNVNLFSDFSHAWENVKWHHEYSQGLTRLVSVWTSDVIFQASFLRKNCPYGFERAPSDSQKDLSKSKGYLSEKMNPINDTKTSELAKSAKDTGIFVIACSMGDKNKCLEYVYGMYTRRGESGYITHRKYVRWYFMRSMLQDCQEKWSYIVKLWLVSLLFSSSHCSSPRDDTSCQGGQERQKWHLWQIYD